MTSQTREPCWSGEPGEGEQLHSKRILSYSLGCLSQKQTAAASCAPCSREESPPAGAVLLLSRNPWCQAAPGASPAEIPALARPGVPRQVTAQVPGTNAHVAHRRSTRAAKAFPSRKHQGNSSPAPNSTKCITPGHLCPIPVPETDLRGPRASEAGSS